MEIPSESWLRPDVEIRSSPIHGLGTFATRSIAQDEVVAVLGGSTMTDAEVAAKIERGERYGGIALSIDLNLTIEPGDWPGIHGNHSCRPNLGMRDEVTTVAMRRIEPGEELTTDYAMYTVSAEWMMACNCGSSLCRRVVTGSDWVRPELQGRYRGYFAPVVRRLIEQQR